MKKLLSLFVLIYTFTISSAFSATAEALLAPTSDASQASGRIVLEETDKGLKISASFEKVSPGEHGFHIHENGDCADAGKAAGGHFNPDGHDHGNVVKDGPTGAHAGDLGNVLIDEKGSGSLEVTVPGLSLTEGKYNVSGKSFILHEKVDDFGQPTGNAGGRIACGIIQTAPTQTTNAS